MSDAIVTPGPYGTSDFTRWFRSRAKAGVPFNLPAGDMTLTETVLIDQPAMRINGAGREQTRLIWGGPSSPSGLMFNFTRSGGVGGSPYPQIDGVSFSGPGKSTGVRCLGLAVLPADANGTICYSGSVHDCGFSGFDAAIQAGQDSPAASEFHFESCEFTNCTAGFRSASYNSLNFRFDHCAWGQCDYGILNVAGGTYVVVGGSTSDVGSYSGGVPTGAFFYTSNVPDCVTIQGIRIENSPSGIVFWIPGFASVTSVVNLIGIVSVGGTRGTDNPLTTRFAISGYPGTLANVIGCNFVDSGAASWTGTGGELNLMGSAFNSTSGVLSAAGGSGPRQTRLGCRTVDSSNNNVATLANLYPA